MCVDKKTGKDTCSGRGGAGCKLKCGPGSPNRGGSGGHRPNQSGSANEPPQLSAKPPRFDGLGQALMDFIAPPAEQYPLAL